MTRHSPRWRSRAHALPLLALCASAALALAACGHGGGATSTPTAASAGRSANPAGNLPPPAAGSHTGAPGVPTSRTGDNSIQTWGLEASAAQRRALTAIVRAFLDARARADWAGACALLAARPLAEFSQLAGAAKPSERACARGMALAARGVPRSAFADEARIERVLSLRVGRGDAFLIYTRADGKAYATGLGHEHGAWRVISVGATPLP
jgi:hypothetical protein